MVCQEVFQSAIRDTVHIEGRVYLKVVIAESSDRRIMVKKRVLVGYGGECIDSVHRERLADRYIIVDVDAVSGW